MRVRAWLIFGLVVGLLATVAWFALSGANGDRAAETTQRAEDGTALSARDAARPPAAPEPSARRVRGESAGVADATEGPGSPAADGRLVVRVLRPDGTPAAGAVVATLIPRQRPIEPSTARADAQGRASFDELELAASDALVARDGTGGIAVIARPAAGTREVVARLAPGLVVTGRVERQDGTPLAETECSLSSDEEWDVHPSLRTATSDEHGVVEFGAIPDLRARLVVSAAVRIPGSPQYGASTSVGADGRFLLRVRDPRMIRGRILDAASGRPVAGAQIRFDNDHTVTARDGSVAWIIERRTGDAIWIDAPSFAPVIVAVPPGTESVDLGDVSLVAGESVRGVAVDSIGRALPGVRVLATGPDGDEGQWSRDTISGDDGSFEVAHLAAGATVALAGSVGGSEEHAKASVVGARAGDSGVRLVVRGPLVVLRFADAAGATIAVRDARVGIGTTAHRDALANVRFPLSGRTAWIVRLPSPGRHTLWVAATPAGWGSDPSPTAVFDVDCPADGAATIDVRVASEK